MVHGTPSWGIVAARLRKSATQAAAHPNLTDLERDMIALVLRNPDAFLARPSDYADAIARLAAIAGRTRTEPR